MDSSSSHQITLHHRSQDYCFQALEGQTILEAGLEAGIDLPSSCQAGVCTTCAARLRQGSVNQAEAMGIAPQLKDQGYVLLCVSYATSDAEIDSDKEDEVYELQFGTAQTK
jgi:ferredoxin